MLITLAKLHIGDPQWLWPAAGLLLCALLVLAWGYRQGRAAAGRRFAPAALKALGLVAIAAFLVNPLWSAQRAKPRANLFITVADNSRSLRIGDKANAESRADVMRRLLTGAAKAGEAGATPAIPTWSIKLAENFDSRGYLVDTRLHSADSFASLTFDGRGSSLLTSLRAIADRYRGRPLAGVLLFTDGNATDLPASGEVDLAGLPPIYPVIIGDDSPAADIGIASVAMTQTAFEDAPVTVSADVSAIGYAGKSVAGELVDESGKVVKASVVKVDGDDKTIAFRFQVKPEKPGVSFYRLRVAEEGKTENIEAKEREAASGGEATLENNTRLLSVDRGRGPYRVLYVSGRPNWEFKFLNRAIAADPQVQLVGLMRIAKREAKFAWRDNVRDATNPLFRGFDPKDKEKLENYDEPVLVRFNTQEDAELRGGFPKTAEDLAKYHALIIDDLEAAFFTRDQLALIEKFVTDRRGGLLMLGGAESMREGEYHRSPLARLLPVYLDRAADGGAPPSTARYRLELTRSGWHEPFIRVRATEEEERKRLSTTPAYATMNLVPSAGIKPGATVLAEVVDERGGRWPAIVTQPFGGRVAAVMIGDVWRGVLRREEDNEDTFKMWRQLVRWMVADVPGRVSGSAEPVRHEADAPMKISVRVKDREYKPQDNARVTVKIAPPAGEPIVLRGEASTSEAGLYELTYLPRVEGAYRATIDAVDAEGKAIGTSELGWVGGEAGHELRSLKPNRALLETIAKQTGGQVVSPDDLDSFVAELPTKKAPMMETTIEPIWDRWWALAIALGCLVGEWTLRRVRGLP